MSSLELKSNFHSLIDKIDNEQLLMKFYEVLVSANNSKVGHLWNNLSDSQQQNLLEIDLETDNIGNAISHDVVFEKFQKWL